MMKCDGWNTFSMIPAGRRSIEAPAKTLPWTHHHQYAVLHSKANIGIWVEGCKRLSSCPHVFVTGPVRLSQQITDEGLVGLCRGCYKLQILCVSGCSNITDASLTAMGLNCPRLKWDTHTDTMALIHFIIHRISLAGMMTRCFFFFFKSLPNCVFIFAFYWLPGKHGWKVSRTRAVHWLACEYKKVAQMRDWIDM